MQNKDHWLRLTKDTNSSSFIIETEELIAEGREIFAIISTIIKNASK